MKKKSSYILPFFPSFERTEMLEKDYRESAIYVFLSSGRKREDIPKGRRRGQLLYFY